MNELIKLVVDRTGVSEETATQAVAVVLGYFKDKLPSPVAAQLESYLGSETSGEDPRSSEGLLSGVKKAFGFTNSTE